MALLFTVPKKNELTLTRKKKESTLFIVPKKNEKRPLTLTLTRTPLPFLPKKNLPLPKKKDPFLPLPL